MIDMFYSPNINIQQPTNYIKTQMTFNDSIQYEQDNNYYIVPYTINANGINKYLYTFTIHNRVLHRSALVIPFSYSHWNNRVNKTFYF